MTADAHADAAFAAAIRAAGLDPDAPRTQAWWDRYEAAYAARSDLRAAEAVWVAAQVQASEARYLRACAAR